MLAAYDWLFAPPGGPPPRWEPQRAAQALAALCSDDGATALVAVDGAAALVGLGTVYLDIRSVRYGQRAWVEDLVVHPQQRSRGVGERLLAAAEGWAREHGATHLELDSGPGRLDAHRFYRRRRPSWESICFGWDLQVDPASRPAEVDGREE